MNWEIITGIITLFGFVVAIGKIISNNTQALTEVKTSLDNLDRRFEQQREEAKNIKKEITEHEHRITVLETKGEDGYGLQKEKR